MSTEPLTGLPSGNAPGGLAEELIRQAEHAAQFKWRYRRRDAVFLVASILFGAGATIISGTSALAQDTLANWLKEQPGVRDRAAPEGDGQQAASDTSKQRAKQLIDALAAICAACATVLVTLHKTLKVSDSFSRGTACHAELASLRIEMDDPGADRTAIRKQYQQILTKYPEIIK